jgi:hypothetical protein
MHFNGSLDALQAIVSLIHLNGHWVDEGEFHTFSCESGEHINLWPSSGELQVKGHPAASRALEERLQRAIAAAAAAGTEPA